MGLKQREHPYSSAEAFAQDVLGALQRGKQDTSKPILFNFFLQLPDKAAAEACANEIEFSLQFDTEVQESDADDLGWICWCTGTLIPTQKHLTTIGGTFLQLAEKHNGSFEGWETIQLKIGSWALLRLIFRLPLILIMAVFKGAMALVPIFSQCLPVMRLQKGVGCLARGQFGKAESIARSVLKQQGDGFDALQLLGHAQLGQRKFQDAAESFKKAIDLHEGGTPGLEEAYLNYGAALDNLGRYDEAISSYAKALEIQPGYATAYYNLANAYLHLQDRQQTLTFLQYAVYLRPEFLQKAKDDEEFRSYLSPEEFEWVGTPPQTDAAGAPTAPA